MVAHSREGGEFFVVDLWRTGFEGLHGPAEEHELALGEVGRRVGGDRGGGLFGVGHVGGGGVGDVGEVSEKVCWQMGGCAEQSDVDEKRERERIMCGGMQALCVFPCGECLVC